MAAQVKELSSRVMSSDESDDAGDAGQREGNGEGLRQNQRVYSVH